MLYPRDLEAYPLLPLSELFAKAVHRAQHLHLVAAETCKDFERKYIPEEQRHSHKSSPSAFCQSETIPAPTGKEDAQQRSDKELLLYSLLLIRSWFDSVQNSRAFRTSDRVYDKLQDLEEGIYALLKILEDGGSSQGFDWLTFFYDRFDGNLSEEALMKNYGLLACFKKDMHKVETYLKLEADQGAEKREGAWLIPKTNQEPAVTMETGLSDRPPYLVEAGIMAAVTGSLARAEIIDFKIPTRNDKTLFVCNILPRESEAEIYVSAG
eukprot:g48193.t1